MGKWLDLAREMGAPCDNSDVTDNSPPNVTNVTNVTGSLPPPIADGLRRLRSMRPPRWATGERWRVFVLDALWLAERGLIADALERGWELVDLLGVSGDDDWQSLATWINGRRDEYGQACLLLTEIRGDRSLPYAVHVRDGRHSWHYRQPAPADAVLPWTM